MKKLGCLIFVAAALSGPEFTYAAKSKCDFSQNTVDAATGEKIVQTKYDSLVTIMGGFESEAYGSVSVASRGGQKFLMLKLDAMDYHALPAEFAQHEDPTWDPAHRDFLDSLLGDAAVFPVGSSIRLDLDDQSSITLKTAKHLRVRTHYANPGEDPRARGTQQKVAKKLGGFLGKALSKAMEKQGFEEVEEDNTSPHYTVMIKAYIEYPIDAEAEAILNRAAVTSMRIESRDRYFRLGWRSTKDQLFSWYKGSYFKVRDALQCVNAETGQGAS